MTRCLIDQVRASHSSQNEDKTLLQHSQCCHKGEFWHVSISARQRSLRCGQNLRGPFLRATLPMTVGSSGGCHSHRLNGQRSNHPTKCSQRSKWSRSTFKSQCGTDQISAVIRSEPSGGVTHARNAYFLTYRLASLGCSSNIKTSLRAKYPSGQRSMAKN